MARRELGGGARQPSGFNNAVRGALVHLYRSPLARAREALMMAGAGGATRATGWRATAIRFQQFGEGGLVHLYRSPLARAREAPMMAARMARCELRGGTCASSSSASFQQFGEGGPMFNLYLLPTRARARGADDGGR